MRREVLLLVVLDGVFTVAAIALVVTGHWTEGLLCWVASEVYSFRRRWLKSQGGE